MLFFVPINAPNHWKFSVLCVFPAKILSNQINEIMMNHEIVEFLGTRERVDYIFGTINEPFNNSRTFYLHRTLYLWRFPEYNAFNI